MILYGDVRWLTVMDFAHSYMFATLFATESNDTTVECDTLTDGVQTFKDLSAPYCVKLFSKSLLFWHFCYLPIHT